jgi:hypothetical protein
MPFIESSEFFKMAVNRGAAIVQIAVTKPVVIRTTKTHPGTSPLWSEIALNIRERVIRSMPSVNLKEIPINISSYFWWIREFIADCFISLALLSYGFLFAGS